MPHRVPVRASRVVRGRPISEERMRVINVLRARFIQGLMPDVGPVCQEVCSPGRVMRKVVRLALWVIRRMVSDGSVSERRAICVFRIVSYGLVFFSALSVVQVLT